jgi:hypothetical protein
VDEKSQTAKMKRSTTVNDGQRIGKIIHQRKISGD